MTKPDIYEDDGENIYVSVSGTHPATAARPTDGGVKKRALLLAAGVSLPFAIFLAGYLDNPPTEFVVEWSRLGLAIAIGASIYFVLRRRNVKRVGVLDAGLAFVVVTALLSNVQWFYY